MADFDNKAGNIHKTPPDLAMSSDSFAAKDLDLFRSLPQALSDRFEILGEAGRGGMGVVYRVHDRETDEVVALKALRPELAADTGLLERFKRELRLARRITHRNVCRVYELYRTPSLCFVTMEFVDGESLRSRLQRSGLLKIEEGIIIAC